MALLTDKPRVSWQCPRIFTGDRKINVAGLGLMFKSLSTDSQVCVCARARAYSRKG